MSVKDKANVITPEGFAAWKAFVEDMKESHVWQDTHNDGRRLAFIAFCRAWNLAHKKEILMDQQENELCQEMR